MKYNAYHTVKPERDKNIATETLSTPKLSEI